MEEIGLFVFSFSFVFDVWQVNSIHSIYVHFFCGCVCCYHFFHFILFRFWYTYLSIQLCMHTDRLLYRSIEKYADAVVFSYKYLFPRRSPFRWRYPLTIYIRKLFTVLVAPVWYFARFVFWLDLNYGWISCVHAVCVCVCTEFWWTCSNLMLFPTICCVFKHISKGWHFQQVTSDGRWLLRWWWWLMDCCAIVKQKRI